MFEMGFVAWLSVESGLKLHFIYVENEEHNLKVTVVPYSVANKYSYRLCLKCFWFFFFLTWPLQSARVGLCNGPCLLNYSVE